MTVLYQQSTLEDKRHPLNQTACTPFTRVRLSHFTLQACDGSIETWIIFAGGSHFLKEAIQRPWLFRKCTQHIQCIDIACTFPDRTQRSFTVEPGHNTLLDITIPTQTLQSLCNE